MTMTKFSNRQTFVVLTLNRMGWKPVGRLMCCPIASQAGGDTQREVPHCRRLPIRNDGTLSGALTPPHLPASAGWRESPRPGSARLSVGMLPPPLLSGRPRGLRELRALLVHPLHEPSHEDAF